MWGEREGMVVGRYGRRVVHRPPPPPPLLIDIAALCVTWGWFCLCLERDLGLSVCM